MRLKKILFPALIIIGTGVTYFLNFEKEHHYTGLFESYDSGFPDFNGYPEEARKLEWQKIVNPLTGTVDPGGNWKALKELEKRGLIRLNIPKTTSKHEILRPYAWQQVNDFFASIAISRIAFNPLNKEQYFFATGEGWFNADASRGAGVWRSNDAGETWNQLTATDSSIFHYCQDLVISPIDGSLYISTRDAGVWRSKDQGESFERVLGVGLGSTNNDAGRLCMSPDGGVWVNMGYRNVDGIYYSDNGDTGTWVKKMNGMPTSGFRRIEFAVAESNDSVLYAIPVHGSGVDNNKIMGIWRTEDHGENWVQISNPGGNKDLAASQGWYDLIIKVDPNDENTAIAGGLYLFKTHDGGQNWIQMTEGDRQSPRDSFNLQYVHVDEHEVHFQNSNTVYIGTDGGIYKTDNFQDSMPTFYDRNKTYNVTQYYAGAISPTPGSHIVLGGTQDNGTNLALSNGVSDFIRITSADGAYCEIDYNDSNIIYTTKQERRMYRQRRDNLLVLDTITNPYITNSNTLFINPIHMDNYDSKVLYQATNRGLWRLKNADTARAESWERATRISGIITAIGSATNLPGIVYFGRNGSGNLLRVDNAYQTSSTYAPTDIDPTESVDDGYVSSVEVNPKAHDHVLMTLSNFGVNSIWECKNTYDILPTWVNHQGDFPDVPVRWASFHPDNTEIAYMATDIGVFYTEKLDGDSTKWLPMNTGLAHVRVQQFRYRPSDRTMLAVTHGRGLFVGKIPPYTTPRSAEFEWNERGPKNIGGRTRTIMVDPNDPTGKTVWAGSVSGGLWVTRNIDSIEHEVVIAHPSAPEVKLHIYPNPIISGQNIQVEISLPEDAHVTADLFDLRGRFLGQLLNETKSAGVETFTLNMKNLPATGMYILAFKVGDLRLTKKVLYFQ